MDNYFLDMATKIYNAAADMDISDYDETKQNDLDLISTALEKVKDYGYYKDDFKALWGALERIYLD